MHRPLLVFLEVNKEIEKIVAIETHINFKNIYNLYLTFYKNEMYNSKCLS